MDWGYDAAQAGYNFMPHQTSYWSQADILARWVLARHTCIRRSWKSNCQEHNLTTLLQLQRLTLSVNFIQGQRIKCGKQSCHKSTRALHALHAARWTAGGWGDVFLAHGTMRHGNTWKHKG
jgi:hypothetical protein